MSMKILQIISAPVGWVALYKPLSPESIELLHAPLAAWALVELDDGTTEVVGLEVNGRYRELGVCGDPDFIGYASPALNRK